GDRLVDRFAPLRQAGLQSAVMVPRVVLGSIEELHESDAPFDEPAGEQALSSEEVRGRLAGSVKPMSRFAFLREVERLGRLALHAEPQFERGDPRLQRAVEYALPL